MEDANQAVSLPGEGCHSLGDMLARQVACTPGAVAFSCGAHYLSYSRLDALSSSLAHWLSRDLAFAPGTRIALQLPNRLAFPVLAMAVFKAALVLVNISVRASVRERDAMLQDSGARALFCQAQGAVAVQVPGVAVHDAAQAIEAAARGTWCVAQPGRSCERTTLALLQYTGGSSGKLKAARLTHGNLLANLGQLQERLGAVYPPAGACMLAPLPFSHIYAFTLSMLGGIFHGHHTVLVADVGDTQALLAALQVKSCQGIFGIDSLYRRLCAHPGMRRLDFAALRIASAGGMPLSPHLARRWQEMTGCPITEGYGLTECGPLVSCNAANGIKPGSQGQALAGTLIRVCDAAGAELPPGSAGEVRIKGPQVMDSYWQRPQETAGAFDSEGWLRTGDVAVLDDAGYLQLCGRSTDMVIVGGFKVWPRELEDCLLSHPGVHDACAVGHGPEFRQELVAFVVAEAGLSAATLRDWCAELLAAYKVPRRIEFLSRLPRSSAGKLQRQRLQRLLAET